MTSLSNIPTGKILLRALLFLSAAILIFLAPKAAVNVDEQLHYPHAKKVVNWYYTLGEDKSCLDTPLTNLKYYGQSVDNATALINRMLSIKNEFLTRHYTGAFFFWLLLLFGALTARELLKSNWAAIITVLLLLATPRLFGHAFGNLKDIPFAAGYVAGLYVMIRYFKSMPKPDWRLAVSLGIAVAFTSSVRVGGLILLAYFALFSALFIIFLKPFVPKQNVSTKPCLVRFLGQFAVIVIVGYFGGLLFWPFALQDVFRNPLESLQLMEHYSVSIRQIFEGEMMWSTQLPWYYLLKWLLISTPEIVFLGLIFYLVKIILKTKYKPTKQLFTELFLLFGLFFPVFYVIIINSNLYSGIRQMLFVLPVMIILSSAGLVYVFKHIRELAGKITLGLFLLLLGTLPLWHQLKTFPEDYIYFNAISGGNKKAWSNFEYDYYFHGIKKSSEYVKEIVKGENVVVAGNCNLSNYFSDSEHITYNYCRFLERSERDWDYGIFGINYIHPELLKNGKWYSTQTEKIFFHKENPIVVILKRKDKFDFEGNRLLENNNFEDAKKMLLTSVKNDPNNVWNIAQLAKIALKEKDFESFKRYLQMGRNIYPEYEPYFLLEAQYFYNRGDYPKSKKVLDELEKINTRYEPAQKLRNAVSKRLNILLN